MRPELKELLLQLIDKDVPLGTLERIVSDLSDLQETKRLLENVSSGPLSYELSMDYIIDFKQRHQDDATVARVALLDQLEALGIYLDVDEMI